MELKEFCDYIKNYSKKKNLINFKMRLMESKKDYTDPEVRSVWKISLLIEGKEIGNSIFKVYKEDDSDEEITVLNSFVENFKSFIKKEMTNYQLFTANIKGEIVGHLIKLGE